MAASGQLKQVSAIDTSTPKLILSLELELILSLELEALARGELPRLEHAHLGTVSTLDRRVARTDLASASVD
jgi:hypothetical protein